MLGLRASHSAPLLPFSEVTAGVVLTPGLSSTAKMTRIISGFYPLAPSHGLVGALGTEFIYGSMCFRECVATLSHGPERRNGNGRSYLPDAY